MKKIIGIQKIGEIDASILQTLRKNLKKVFKGYNLKFKVFRDGLSLSDAEYGPKGKQYKSKLVLDKIISHLEEKDYFRGLGIMDKDAYSSGKDYVFGCAYKPHTNYKVAFISILRLSETFYSRSENRNKLNDRLFKEAIHELGHTFGLEHCNNYCVMQFSKDLADANKKPSEYCETCLNQLTEFLTTST